MAEAGWYEIKLTVDGELAEAVSEVFSRFTLNGVVVESDVRYNDAEDEGTPYGPVRVYGYLPADEQVEQKRNQISEALFYLGLIQPLPEPSYRWIANENWMESWKQHYNPIPIGEKLMILPAWIEKPEAKYKDRLVIKIDPSMAFGTGTHPTTQLCLLLLEKYLQPGEQVIDVGCGSGILSIGAQKLGSPQILAVDIDPESVKATAENAEANCVLQDLMIGQGSVTEILAGQFPLQKAPLVVANILAPVIIRLFDAGLADLAEDNGHMILSGILDHQAADVINRAEQAGLQYLETVQQKDWVALAFQKA